jgi:hypothetical protein
VVPQSGILTGEFMLYCSHGIFMQHYFVREGRIICFLIAAIVKIEVKITFKLSSIVCYPCVTSLVLANICSCSTTSFPMSAPTRSKCLALIIFWKVIWSTYLHPMRTNSVLLTRRNKLLCLVYCSFSLCFCSSLYYP